MVFTGEYRNVLLEFLRNLTPQILLFSVAMLFYSRLDPTHISLTWPAFGNFLLFALPFFTTLVGYIVNVSVFIDKMNPPINLTQSKLSSSTLSPPTTLVDAEIHTAAVLDVARLNAAAMTAALQHASAMNECLSVTTASNPAAQNATVHSAAALKVAILNAAAMTAALQYAASNAALGNNPVLSRPPPPPPTPPNAGPAPVVGATTMQKYILPSFQVMMVILVVIGTTIAIAVAAVSAADTASKVFVEQKKP